MEARYLYAYARRYAGFCPVCGKELWLNDVPLRGFCWGEQDRPHREYRCEIPSPFNPYKPGYDRDAKVDDDA